MAATSHPLATATALDILKGGGNAVDAAIAAAATLCVVEPHMTGIGGDCFVIVAEPDGATHGLNGSGRASARVDADWYRAQGFSGMPQTGALSVTVPGAVDAWQRLADRFGALGFERLFADAIRYAEDGFAIHPRVAWDWGRQVEALARDEGAARHFLAGGKTPALGARWRLPALGATLRAIAAGGAKAFYEGPIAAEIAATVTAQGGFMTEADLAAVQADWVKPIAARYNGFDVLEIPPNGQGITALILLELMTRLDAGSLAPDSPERWHLMIEAGRLAYSVRDHMVADPEAMTATPRELLSPARIAALAARFDPARRNPDIAAPDAPASDTIYLTVVDRDRRAVSFINSLYDAFGSRVTTPRSGVALQNRGACFTLEKGHPNEIGPGKRPMHTIIPAMAMKSGRAAVSFGVMGGDYQPMGHAHLFSNMSDHGMDPQEAIDHGRMFWGEDGVLNAEAGIGAEIRAALEAKGHRIRDAARPHGGAQAIVIDHESGFLVAGSDPRKDGLALGW